MRSESDYVHYAGLRLVSVKHLPAEARAMRFLQGLSQFLENRDGQAPQAAEMAASIKHAWRANKKNVTPLATNIRVDTLVRKGEDFPLLVIIIRFKEGHEKRVGVCGTPKGLLWRLRRQEQRARS